MAEKGFGVKDINLIGPSGTPTITSPNNLNLNANNVAISTNVSIGGTLSVTGNVSVGGTLTYEDVTNIDSVGIVTARDGVVVVGRGVSITAGGLNVTAGVTTFNTDVDFKGSGGATKILYDASQDALEFADSATLAFGSHPGTGDYQINYVNGGDFAILAMQGGSQDLVVGRYENAATKKHLVSTRAGVIELYHDNSKKLETNSSGVNVTGAITVNGSALSIDPTNSDIQVVYTVTANGASAYRFAGNGVVSTADNPDLYLIRGKKYRFVNNSGGSHPFQIRESSGGTAYSTGVTNNGAASGNIDFAPTYDSPAQLVYQCTSHGGMVGTIYLRGAGANNENVGLTTFSGVSISSNGATVTPSGYDLKIRSNTGKLGVHIDNSSGTPTLEFGTGNATTGGAITTNSHGIFLKPAGSDSLKVETLGVRSFATFVDTSYHANPDPFGDGSGIVYYRLNDNFHDSGMFAKHGTSSQGGDPTFAFQNSSGERCWNNPADGAINIPNLKNSYPFTMAAWVNISSWPTSSNNDLIMNLSIGGQRVSLCIVKWADRSTSDPAIMYGGTSHWVFPASSRPTNTWIHLVYSVVASNNSGHAVYQNGSALSAIDKGSSHGGSAGWAIGGNASDSERFAMGRIGSIRFFNKAISSSEASALYTNDKFYT